MYKAQRNGNEVQCLMLGVWCSTYITFYMLVFTALFPNPKSFSILQVIFEFTLYVRHSTFKKFRIQNSELKCWKFQSSKIPCMCSYDGYGLLYLFCVGMENGKVHRISHFFLSFFCLRPQASGKEAEFCGGSTEINEWYWRRTFLVHFSVLYSLL